MARIPLADRLTRKVDRGGGSEACWPWTGATSKQGYGVIGRGGKGAGMVLVHRAAYELAHGPIPAGLEVDHRCHVAGVCTLGPACPHRRCCNPAHLIATTRAHNMARGNKATGPRPAALRSHCRNGHPYDDENTARTKAGHRRCIECGRRGVSRFSERQRAYAPNRPKLSSI